MFEVILIVACVLTMCASWYMYTVLIPSACQDLHREDFFSFRNELFEYAQNGHISFENQAYGIVRDTLNGFIRFSHRVSFLDYMFSQLYIKKTQEDYDKYKKKRNNAMNNLSDEQREKLTSIQMKMHHTVMRVLISNSIIMKPVFSVMHQTAFLLKAGNTVSSKYKKIKKSMLVTFDSDAYQGSTRINQVTN